MIVESLQNNVFYQMPYQSRSIASTEVIDETTWFLLPAVKLLSIDFMLEMFVRQKTISRCSEFLRIGPDFNAGSKFLTFNKKSGSRLSLSLNGFKNDTYDFVFRKVFMFFTQKSKR